MEIKRAAELLRGLADGVDPMTGRPLPDESVYNRPEIIRALHTEIEAQGLSDRVEVVRTGERMGQTVCTPGGNVLVLDQVDLPRYQQCLLAGLLTL